MVRHFSIATISTGEGRGEEGGRQRRKEDTEGFFDGDTVSMETREEPEIERRETQGEGGEAGAWPNPC